MRERMQELTGAVDYLIALLELALLPSKDLTEALGKTEVREVRLENGAQAPGCNGDPLWTTAERPWRLATLAAPLSDLPTVGEVCGELQAVPLPDGG